jgi:hypothetical protein
MATMNRIAATVIIGTSCFASAGYAADASFRNFGSVPCEQYLAVIRAPEQEALYYSWAQGFMAGLNQDLLAAEPAHFFDLDHDPSDQKAGLRSYCSVHPKSLFSDAVNALFQTLPLVDRRPPPPR